MPLDLGDLQVGVLADRIAGHDLEVEPQRVWHDLAQPPDAEADDADRALLRVLDGRVQYCAGDRKLMHPRVSSRLLDWSPTSSRPSPLVRQADRDPRHVRGDVLRGLLIGYELGDR